MRETHFICRNMYWCSSSSSARGSGRPPMHYSPVARRRCTHGQNRDTRTYTYERARARAVSRPHTHTHTRPQIRAQNSVFLSLFLVLSRSTLPSKLASVPGGRTYTFSQSSHLNPLPAFFLTILLLSDRMARHSISLRFYHSIPRHYRISTILTSTAKSSIHTHVHILFAASFATTHSENRLLDTTQHAFILLRSFSIRLPDVHLGLCPIDRYLYGLCIIRLYVYIWTHSEWRMRTLPSSPPRHRRTPIQIYSLPVSLSRVAILDCQSYQLSHDARNYFTSSETTQ